MGFFERHLFVCTNARHDACRKSCNDHGEGDAALDFLRGQAKEMGLIGPGKLRISGSGCLGACDDGPAMVLYPEGRWYTYADAEDLREILEEDLVNRRAVARLQIGPTK